MEDSVKKTLSMWKAEASITTLKVRYFIPLHRTQNITAIRKDLCRAKGHIRE